MANILFITPCLGFGGAEKMLTFVAEELHKRGHAVSIVNIQSVVQTTNYVREVDEGISLYNLPLGKGKLKRFKQILQIKDIAKKNNIQVIVGFTPFANAYAKIVGTMLNIPSIMSERGDPARLIPKSLKSKIINYIINRSKGGVFQIDGAKEFYGKGLQKRGVVIPNPIFVNGEIPSVNFEDREKTVVSVGRLDNFQKRYDVMLDAFKIFINKHPEYLLKLYGKGSDEELIKKWVEDRNLTNKVEFMGLTTKPMQDIAKDGMFLITSDYEGISNSLLEAMAVGLPCVSTDHTPGGARLLITHEENGLLAPIGDKEKLAECMCKFAEDSELAKNCGENAKDVLIRFAPTKIIDMWEEYIIKIIKK